MSTSVSAARHMPAPWHSGLAGFSALLLGIGFARFAYAPIIPALVQAGWFTPDEAGYLGATNLAGYLIGSAVSRHAAEKLPTVAVIKAAMLIGAASFFACALPWGFTWYFVWRFIAGVVGGVAMIVASTAVLSAAPAERRNRLSGMIFTGVGAGIALSGTFVPWLVGFGVSTAWIALGALALALTAMAWGGWPEAAPAQHDSKPEKVTITWRFVLLLFSYGLIGFAFSPHTVFWADYIARALDRGIAAGGFNWLLMGCGAIIGPMLTARLADRIGPRPAYVVMLTILGFEVGLPVLWPHDVILWISSFGVGATSLSVTSVAVSVVSEMTRDVRQQRQLWAYMTLIYAAVYAGSSYLYAWMLAKTGAYEPIFLLGAATGFVGAICAWISSRRRSAA